MKCRKIGSHHCIFSLLFVSQREASASSSLEVIKHRGLCGVSSLTLLENIPCTKRCIIENHMIGHVR